MVSLCKELLLPTLMSADAFAAASPLRISALSAAATFSYHAKVTLVLFTATRLSKSLRRYIEKSGSLSYMSRYYTHPKEALLQIAVDTGVRCLMAFAIGKATQAFGWRSSLPSWIHGSCAVFLSTPTVPEFIQRQVTVPLTKSSSAAVLSSVTNLGEFSALVYSASCCGDVTTLVKRAISRLKNEHYRPFVNDVIDFVLDATVGAVAVAATALVLSETGVLQLGRPRSELKWWQLSVIGGVTILDITYAVSNLALCPYLKPEMKSDPIESATPFDITTLSELYFAPLGKLSPDDLATLEEIICATLEDIRTNSALLYMLQSLAAMDRWVKLNRTPAFIGEDHSEDHHLDGEDQQNARAADEVEEKDESVLVALADRIFNDAHDLKHATLPAHMEACDVKTLKQYIRVHKLLPPWASRIEGLTEDVTLPFKTNPVDIAVCGVLWLCGCITLTIE